MGKILFFIGFIIGSLVTMMIMSFIQINKINEYEDKLNDLNEIE